ncbi:cupin [Bermanella marisrubri]|uniref:Predicted transcription negative regulator n=1 Tax=Bermanella marisrubri TaxID=207949 RepID=Q1MZG5_9GAMM|nr:cupin domain-containing protein [Bermanella marisrubri]EAT11301.1 Predicted transcription negative regulator [Oceanobacter sp. RED65] [Bermanella marisrubri]QIZ85310.1 cupin [Bermanella marisrubri]
MEPFNLDRSQVSVIRTQEQAWQDSPMAGVRRIPLEREAAESGQVTSIVEYEAGSEFRPHKHPMGEEIFVLEGVFSDQSGDYPAGSYLRNPPGSQHAPFSKSGCKLFVKLNQFQQGDQQTIALQSDDQPWLQGQGGLMVKPLHDFQGEHTALVFWPAGERFVPHRHFGGEEILVVSGCFKDEHGEYPAGTWIRSPHMSEHYPFVDEDTVIMVKVGHLHPDLLTQDRIR